MGTFTYVAFALGAAYCCVLQCVTEGDVCFPIGLRRNLSKESLESLAKSGWGAPAGGNESVQDFTAPMPETWDKDPAYNAKA
jgi:hypothetical protein